MSASAPALDPALVHRLLDERVPDTHQLSPVVLRQLGELGVHYFGDDEVAELEAHGVPSHRGSEAGILADTAEGSATMRPAHVGKASVATALGPSSSTRTSVPGTSRRPRRPRSKTSQTPPGAAAGSLPRRRRTAATAGRSTAAPVSVTESGDVPTLDPTDNPASATPRHPLGEEGEQSPSPTEARQGATIPLLHGNGADMIYGPDSTASDLETAAPNHVRLIPVLSDPERERARLLEVASEPLPQRKDPASMRDQIAQIEHVASLFDGSNNHYPLKAPPHMLEIIAAGTVPSMDASRAITAALVYELVNYDDPGNVPQEAVARNVTVEEYDNARAAAAELKQAALAIAEYEMTDPNVIYSERIATNMPAAADVMAKASNLCWNLIKEARSEADPGDSGWYERVFPSSDWQRVMVGVADFLAEQGYSPATHRAAYVEVMYYIRDRIEQERANDVAKFYYQPAPLDAGPRGTPLRDRRAGATPSARPFDGNDAPRPVPTIWSRLKGLVKKIAPNWVQTRPNETDSDNWLQ